MISRSVAEDRGSAGLAWGPTGGRPEGRPLLFVGALGDSRSLRESTTPTRADVAVPKNVPGVVALRADGEVAAVVGVERRGGVPGRRRERARCGAAVGAVVFRRRERARGGAEDEGESKRDLGEHGRVSLLKLNGDYVEGINRPNPGRRCGAKVAARRRRAASRWRGR